MAKRYRRQISLQVSGRFARFTDVDTSADPRTYLVPPASALRGMLKTLLHRNSLFVLPQRVEYLPYHDPVTQQDISTVETMPLSTYHIRLKNKPEPWFGAPVSSTLLYGVHYRVHYLVEGTQAHLDELEERIKTNNWDWTPYLGIRECVATIRPVDDTPVLHGISILGEKIRVLPGGKEVEMPVRNGVLTYPPAVEQAFRQDFYARMGIPEVQP